MKTHFVERTHLILMFILLTGAGCTSQNAYDSLRYHQELECQKIQGSERDDCMRKSDMSYDEYQLQLKKLQQSE